MSLRFRKSIKIAPGLRLNVSGSGLGISIGPRGASIGIGRRGTFLNTGIPGTGLYSRTKLSGPTSQNDLDSISASPKSEHNVRIRINDDGELSFESESGQPLPQELVNAAKKQGKPEILAIMEKMNRAINDELNSITSIHLDTPNPRTPPSLLEQKVTDSEPTLPKIKQIGFFKSLFKHYRNKADEEYRNKIEEYHRRHNEWEIKSSKHNAEQAARKKVFDEALAGKPESMEILLCERISAIKWPRETIASIEARDNGRKIYIDIDFPEEDDIPTKSSEMPSRGIKLKIKKFSETQIRKIYLEHIHSIAFRVVGEVFHSLPGVESVVLSGFSQRASKETGAINDEYILSVEAKKSEWEKIDFSNLNEIEVIPAMHRFNMIIDMTKSGILKPIKPLHPIQE